MIRGILSGAVFGVFTVAVAFSVASLLAQQPAGNTPPLTPQVDAPSEAVGDNAEGTTPDLAADDSEAGLITAETPLVTAPEDTPDAVLADTESAALPETGLPEAELSAPDDLSAISPPAVLAGTEVPVLPNPQSVAPQVPVPEEDLTLATDPAIPTPVPVVIEEEAAVIEQEAIVAEPQIAPEMAEVVVEVPDDPAEAEAPVADLVTPDEAVVAEAESETPATLPVETEAPPSDMSVAAVEEPVEPVPETAVVGDEQGEPVADQTEPMAEPTDPAAADIAAVEPIATEQDLAEPETVETDATQPQPAEPDVAALEPAQLEVTAPDPVQPEAADPKAIPTPDAADATPATVDPVAPLPAVNARESDATALPETDSTVRINRLGGEEEAVPELALTDDPSIAEGEVNLIPEEQGPALERFAAAFDNPEVKPLMSVILIDDGSLAGASIALGSLPFPVTVALDPGTDGAADRMANYRAAGIEVMAIARLPQGARPADVMVTFESVFATLPEAIGVLDAGEGGLQANSAVADQAMMRFAADGRGVVTMDEGLNMAARAAAEAGVPAGLIYRDLDGEGQSVQVIRRFLDQAAFRARQDSGVILLGRVQADTLSALNLWGGQNRAGQVALVPVSAVLLQ